MELRFKFKNVNMYWVNSSHVNAVGYDKETNRLYVEYADNEVYEYDNVPENMWEDLQRVDSKGSWLHWWIKINSNEFPYRLVIEDDVTLLDSGQPTPNPGQEHPDGYMTGF